MKGSGGEGKKIGASRKRLALGVFVAAIRLEETLSGGTKPNETYVAVIDLCFIISLTFCFIFSIQPHSSTLSYSISFIISTSSFYYHSLFSSSCIVSKSDSIQNYLSIQNYRLLHLFYSTSFLNSFLFNLNYYIYKLILLLFIVFTVIY